MRVSPCPAYYSTSAAGQFVRQQRRWGWGKEARDASLAMTFNFSRLPFSVLVGYLVFGEMIEAWTWVGAIVIFAASVFVTYRESKLARNTISSQE